MQRTPNVSFQPSKLRKRDTKEEKRHKAKALRASAAAHPTNRRCAFVEVKEYNQKFPVAPQISAKRKLEAIASKHPIKRPKKQNAPKIDIGTDSNISMESASECSKRLSESRKVIKEAVEKREEQKTIANKFVAVVPAGRYDEIVTRLGKSGVLSRIIRVSRDKFSGKIEKFWKFGQAFLHQGVDIVKKERGQLSTWVDLSASKTSLCCWWCTEHIDMENDRVFPCPLEDITAAVLNIERTRKRKWSWRKTLSNRGDDEETSLSEPEGQQEPRLGTDNDITPRRVFRVTGYFCSWECAAAYGRRELPGQKERDQCIPLIRRMISQSIQSGFSSHYGCCVFDDNALGSLPLDVVKVAMFTRSAIRSLRVKCAPPRQHLVKFGGPLTRDEFIRASKDEGSEDAIKILSNVGMSHMFIPENLWCAKISIHEVDFVESFCKLKGNCIPDSDDNAFDSAIEQRLFEPIDPPCEQVRTSSRTPTEAMEKRQRTIMTGETAGIFNKHKNKKRASKKSNSVLKSLLVFGVAGDRGSDIR